MAQSASLARLANRALALLGSVDRLTSIDGMLPVEVQFRGLWDESRRAFLASHPWNFAIARPTVNPTALPAPTMGWTHRAQLPPECLRWLPNAMTDVDGVAAEEEGGFLLCRQSTPFAIRCIVDVEDLSRWSPAAFDAMAYRIAAEMAEGVTQSTSTANALAMAADEKLIEARRLDGLATGTRSRGSVRMSSRWQDARFSGVVR